VVIPLGDPIVNKRYSHEEIVQMARESLSFQSLFTSWRTWILWLDRVRVAFSLQWNIYQRFSFACNEL